MAGELSQVQNIPSALTRAWAQQLLAMEAPNQSAPDAHLHETVRVWEKLRISLTRFAGADAFTALLRRAIALAKADVPSLHAVKVTADGRMEGIEEFAADGGRGGVEITAHLLALLVTFIGESLTLRLVHDAWPGVRLDK